MMITGCEYGGLHAAVGVLYIEVKGVLAVAQSNKTGTTSP